MSLEAAAAQFCHLEAANAASPAGRPGVCCRQMKLTYKGEERPLFLKGEKKVQVCARFGGAGRGAGTLSERPLRISQ